MKKFVNLRLPVIIALSLCGGIALGVILYYYNLSIVWVAFSILPASIIFGIAALIKKKVIRPAVFVLLPLMLFIGGTFNSFYSISRFARTEVYPEVEYSVHGVVTEKGITANGEYIIIKNITVDGNKINGKAYVYLSDTYGELCDVGYSVDFVGALEKLEPFQYGQINSYTEENVKYRASVFAGLRSTYGYTFFGSIRSAIGKTLFNNLHQESAAVAYAMLTGNTRLVEADSIQSFRYGGVAHIFAVSGLHIGIVYAIVSFIVRKLRIRWYPAVVLRILAILFYTAICGFSVSAVRATIMCIVALLALVILKGYDSLNSLALAVIIILSYSPLSLFSVGFQLSVCAVGGIFCLSKCIEKVLQKIRIPKPIRSAAGVSAGAQLGTMPILLSNFGYISWAGLILNLVVLPILSVVFIILFVSTMLCTIIPAIAPYVIPYTTLPLEFTISVFTGIGFEKALISGFGAGAFIPLYFIGVLSLSDKINLKLLPRIIALACSIIVLASYVLIRNYSPLFGYRVTISAYGSGGEVLIKSPQGAVLILTDDVNTARLENMLNRNYCNSIDAVIVIGENDLSLYADLGIDCKTVYICDRYPQIQPYGDLLINYATDFIVCKVNYTFLDQNTLLADVGGVTIGICADENNQLLSCDICVSDTQPQLVDCGIKVFFNNRLGTLNVFDCGDITFRITPRGYNLVNAIPPKR